MDRCRVELIPAHVWTCPDCGTDHFARAVAVEVGDMEMAELRDQLGIEPWQEGSLLTAPKRVRCPDCGQRFETAEFGETEHSA